MDDFNGTMMKKTLSIIAMATAMVFRLEAQEIGNEELVRIRESFARTREDIARDECRFRQL